MPLSAEHKQQSRERILTSAAKLFMHQGFDQTSVDQIMNDAELTRGAFYAHFSSKSDLYQQAIVAAAKKTPLAQGKPESTNNRDWLEYLIDNYLNIKHLKEEKNSCPLAFLATDIASREPEVKNTYSQVFKNFKGLVGKYTLKEKHCTEEEIEAISAMTIGSVAVARALNNEEDSKQLLENCNTMIKKLLITSD